MLSFFIPPEGDLIIYYQNSFIMHVLRLSPYNDFFFIYPPIAIIPIWLPGIIAKNIFSYEIMFQLEMAFFGIISLYLLYKISQLFYSQQEIIKKIIIFFLLFLIFSILIYNRIDIFITAINLASIYFLFKENFLLSSLFLSFSIWIKFYPVIFIPLFFFFVFKNYKFKKALFWSGSFFLIFLLILLIFIFNFSFSKSEFYTFFFHLKRPLHVESLYGGILLLLEKIKITNLEFVIKNDSYGWDLYGTNLLNILPLAGSILMIFILGISILKIIKNIKFTKENFLKFYTLFTLLFIILNKVFSPQYLIWLLPFVPLVFDKKEIKIFALVCLLTILIYPLFYKELIEKNIILILILNIRNLILLFLTINFGRKLIFSPNKKIAKKEIPKKSN